MGPLTQRIQKRRAQLAASTIQNGRRSTATISPWVQLALDGKLAAKELSTVPVRSDG